MGVATPNPPRALAGAILFLLTALLGFLLLLPGSMPGDALQRTSYDSLHSLAGERVEVTANSPVAIVYLDWRSFNERNLDPARPWPRELHAQLLRRLKAAGAKAAVLDIVFSAAGANAEADRDLAHAIRDNGNVILAAEYNDKASAAMDNEQRLVRFGTVGRVYAPFAHAAAGTGVASLGIDDDRGVRRFAAGLRSSGAPALTWAAASRLQLTVTQSENAMAAANRNWIRYYGPPLSIPHVGYSQALAPDGVRDDFFRGKVVFVGARPLVGLFNDPQDEFRSPFHSWQNKELFLPGVEVHATEMLNLIRGDWLKRLAPGSEAAILIFIALLFGGGLVWLRPIPATILSVGGAALALGLSVAGFSRGVWFPWLIVCGVQIPAALGGSVLFYSVEWYRARKRFEAAKKIADAKIREQAALIDKAHDAILVQDLCGQINYANPSAERLYGWKLAELQREGPSDEMFSPDPKSAEAARAAVLKDGEWNGELRQQTKAGHVVTVASRWTLIRDDAGQPKALLLMNSDITEQKQLEAQFLRTQRMNTIGTLAGGMAHDLNNALAPILMGVQLLRRKTADEESRALLGLMETSTHRGAEMVRQVLLFARGRGGEFERLEIGPLVRELENMVRETFPKSITIESFLPDDLWPTSGNPTQIHQVLLNLCVNARDAMRAGGRLAFAADNVELNEAEAASIPGAKLGQYVSLLVSDTGAGMPPEVQARIFEPFFTTKGEDRGTGIGLSTVMRIVTSHGGCLRVESEPGQGTTFEIFLPRAIEAAQVVAATPATEPPRGNGELILVVDDERAIRDLVSEGLASHGYRVIRADNGEQAIQLFQQYRLEVCLLVTDGAMPVMDGRRAVAEMRKLEPNLPVVFTSAGVEGDETTPGQVIFLPKPFSLEEILAVIGLILNKK